MFCNFTHRQFPPNNTLQNDKAFSGQAGLIYNFTNGLAPYVILLSVFMLANFAVVLCGALHAKSEAQTSAVIIVTNMGVSIFMFSVGAIPAIGTHMFEARPVWNDTVWTVLTVEFLTLVVAFALPLLVAARRRDFI